MKKTDLFTKIAAAVVFLALAVYLGIYFYRSVEAPVITAPAVHTTLRREIQVSGILVREESLLESDAAYLSMSVSDGKRVAKGSPIAVTYSNASAAQRAEQIRELELEISQTERLLSGLVSAEEVTARDSAVRSAVRGLSAAVARHDLNLAGEESLHLRSLLLMKDAQTSTAGDLILMRSELDKLRRSAAGDTQRIYAPKAGLFSAVLDGYEHLGLKSMDSLTPEALQSLMDSRQEIPAHAIGKIVEGDSWYYIARMSGEDFDAAGDTLRKGNQVALEMGRYYSEPLSLRVEEVGREEDGSRVLRFSCDRAMAETLVVRLLSATLIVEERSGIRVPAEAVYTETDEAGVQWQYIYTLTGVQAEKKYIRILWEDESFYLAEPGEKGSMLRPGNEIIVRAKGLYDGKIME